MEVIPSKRYLVYSITNKAEFSERNEATLLGIYTVRFWKTRCYGRVLSSFMWHACKQSPPLCNPFHKKWKSGTTRSIETKTPRLLASKPDLPFPTLILPPLPLSQPLDLDP